MVLKVVVNTYGMDERLGDVGLQKASIVNKFVDLWLIHLITARCSYGTLRLLD